MPEDRVCCHLCHRPLRGKWDTCPECGPEWDYGDEDTDDADR